MGIPCIRLHDSILKSNLSSSLSEKRLCGVSLLMIRVVHWATQTLGPSLFKVCHGRPQQEANGGGRYRSLGL